MVEVHVAGRMERMEERVHVAAIVEKVFFLFFFFFLLSFL